MKREMVSLIRFLACIIFLTIFPGNPLNAQVTRTDGFVDTNLGRPGSIINEIPYVPHEYHGSFYIRDEWCKGDIITSQGDSITNYPLKFDIENQRLEIQVNDRIKVLGRAEIARFQWYDESKNQEVLFVNANQYEFIGSKAVGIFEVLVDGDNVKLLSLRKTEIREGNYNQQIDIGDRTPKIVQKELFFIWRDGWVNKLTSSKRKTLLLFRGKADAISSYAKERKLSMKKRGDLIEIVAYYQTL